MRGRLLRRRLDMWEAIAGIVAVLLAIIAFINKRNDKKDARKKEISDAVKSQDVGRINAVIDRLRK
jgi:hypothetical protein